MKNFVLIFAIFCPFITYASDHEEDIVFIPSGYEILQETLSDVMDCALDKTKELISLKNVFGLLALSNLVTAQTNSTDVDNGGPISSLLPIILSAIAGLGVTIALPAGIVITCQMRDTVNSMRRRIDDLEAGNKAKNNDV